LARSVRRFAPLALPGEEPLEFTHVHVGPGAYPTGRRVSGHRHDAMQIEYVLNGRFLFSAAGRRIDLSSGRGVVIPPGRKHAWRCVKRGVMVGGMVRIGRGGGKRERLRRQSHEPWIPVAGLQVAARLGDLLAAIFREPPRRFRDEELASCLGLWLVEILREVWPDEPGPDTRPIDEQNLMLCRRAEAFIESNLPHAVTMTDVAAEVGLSARHLNRIYRHSRGRTVGGALQEARLRRASRLLTADPERPIKAIAYECGFRSPAYFTACFRRAFGCPPGIFRAKSDGILENS